jgi:hypothetical protein
MTNAPSVVLLVLVPACIASCGQSGSGGWASGPSDGGAATSGSSSGASATSSGASTTGTGSSGSSGGGTTSGSGGSTSSGVAPSEGGASTPDAASDAGPVPHTIANGGFGMYNVSLLTHAETVTGRHMDLVMDFRDWPSGTAAWPTIPASTLSAIGNRPMMWTIQPSGVNWANLIAGDYDAPIIAFADWVNSTITGPLYLRFAHEANGVGWYSWQVLLRCHVWKELRRRIQPCGVRPEGALLAHPHGVRRDQRVEQHRGLLSFELRHPGPRHV